MAKRVQRKRTRGWRKPYGVVNVTRPGALGNPFVLFELDNGRWKIKDTRDDILYFHSYPSQEVALDRMLKKFRRYAKKKTWALSALRGKDVMCWCPLDKPCHGDIWIELANEEG